MSSRTKLLMQMAIQAQEKTDMANENHIQTASFDDSFSAGYIELSPVHLMHDEEILPIVPECQDNNIIFSVEESLARQEAPLYTELSPVKIFSIQDREALTNFTHLRNNLTSHVEQKEISLDIRDVDGFFNGEDNFQIVNKCAKDLEDKEDNCQFKITDEFGSDIVMSLPISVDARNDFPDKNFESESRFDSDDSDINLQALSDKKKERKIKDINENGGQHTIYQETNNEQSVKKSRKRQRNEGHWKRNDTKKKRNSGQAYKTILNQKIVPKRHLRAPCTDSCRYKCFSVFTPEERESILKAFWTIGDNTRQRQYISSNIIEVKPKYRYPKNDTKRTCNQSYFLPKNKENVRVCKHFFMATLNIGDTMIRTTLKKRDENGIVENEMRGKHENHKRLDQSLIDGVKSHIESIPRVESHYLRNQTHREFFEGDLNIITLYRLYREQCIQSGKNYVKKCIYDKIFNSQYNIGFFKPKKDQCSTCETYKNSSTDEKRELEESYQKHIKEKEMSRAEKAKDIKEAMEEENKKVAVYDLQAVLSTPSGEVSSFYYKSKLATYNFTIFDIVPKQGYCYVWSENCAKRGANEIGSCILRFLQESCNGKSITFYSDNCAGQNKNKFVAAMYLFAVSSYNIESITHKFLVTGHTQNEGDSMHSCIEREKKRVLKSGPIYVPSQWIPVIRLAKKNGAPYKVFEIDTSDIFNLKDLSNQIGPNYNVNTKGEKVSWNEIKILSFTKNAPNSIFYKIHYDQSDYSEIDVRGRRSIRHRKCILKKAYEEAPKISKNKKEGLLYLCKSKAIKPTYHSFYENLPCEN